MDKESLTEIKEKVIMGKIFLLYLVIWTYAPIIAGILLPMIIFIPLAYVSWRVLELWGSNAWYDSWFVINPEDAHNVQLLFSIELIIFIGGLFLFGFSLYHLIKARRHHVRITKQGHINLFGIRKI